MFIPKCLWNESVLHLSKNLNETYFGELKKHSLLETAKQFNGHQGGHGGPSQTDTHKHYACLFGASAARVQCVLLDPKRAFGNISRDLILSLSSHRIALLDMPCGTGAGGIALLTAMKELRDNSIVPNTPLSVDVIGADISISALSLYSSQIDKLRPRLAESGITVTLDCRKWDALDLQSTSDLVEDYLSLKANEHIILMANFSGEGKRNFKQFKNAFEYMFARISHRSVKHVTSLWVEPSGQSGKSYIKLWWDLIVGFAGYASRVEGNEECVSCEYDWFSHIQSKKVDSNVAVQEFKRISRP